MNNNVIITGALGGIGKALCKAFTENDYFVIGVDKKQLDSAPNCDRYFSIDLLRLTNDQTYMELCFNKLSELKLNLKVLVNNAAVQLLSSTENIKLNEWEETLAVNVTAPLLLSQWSIPFLEKNSGCIINISSIHQKLTKPKFVSYATSKSALVGLTQSMAVDLNGRVRVNAISPAAIETEMLKAGFDGNEEALDKLKDLHPIKRIGYPHEVANLAIYLAKSESEFVNGANLQIDGGISSVLHDI